MRTARTLDACRPMTANHVLESRETVLTKFRAVNTFTTNLKASEHRDIEEAPMRYNVDAKRSCLCKIMRLAFESASLQISLLQDP